ncbi:MAG: hypothetical protein HY561_01645 [Gemmatimonadetes bacterium]|nr:hypothetical protein [Gemmatimonadota bacterium]
MRRPGTLLLTVLVGCAPAAGAPETGPAPARTAAPAASQDTSKLVPPGFGTLRQDEITVSLRSGALLVKVTPLSEAVIRLTAPDTYDRLHALAANRRIEAERAAGAAGVELFLVSFFSYQPDVVFQPEDLQLEHQGRVLRAVAILPLTPEWGKQRLQQQETQAAIYGFPPGLDYELALEVRYGPQESDAWSQIIPKLEVERAKARARAG